MRAARMQPTSRTITATFLIALVIALATLAAPGRAPAQTPDASDWASYGGDVFGTRFSSLSEIDRMNVASLQVAWTYRTGELARRCASGAERRCCGIHRYSWAALRADGFPR